MCSLKESRERNTPITSQPLPTMLFYVFFAFILLSVLNREVIAEECKDVGDDLYCWKASTKGWCARSSHMYKMVQVNCKKTCRLCQSV
ncbi:shTK domain protein [Cooperia oncophora]